MTPLQTWPPMCIHAWEILWVIYIHRTTHLGQVCHTELHNTIVDGILLYQPQSLKASNLTHVVIGVCTLELEQESINAVFLEIMPTCH